MWIFSRKFCNSISILSWNVKMCVCGFGIVGRFYFVLSVFLFEIEIYILPVERKSKSIFDEQWRRTNAKKRLNAKQANWILLRVAWLMNPIIYTPLPPLRARENRKKQTHKHSNKITAKAIGKSPRNEEKKNQPNRPNQQIKLESEREKRTRQT